MSREVSRAAGCVNDSEEGLSQGRERLRSQWVEEIGKILWQLESTGWWVWVSSIWEENSDESWDMLASGFGCNFFQFLGIPSPIIFPIASGWS